MERKEKHVTDLANSPKDNIVGCTKICAFFEHVVEIDRTTVDQMKEKMKIERWRQMNQKNLEGKTND